MKVLVTGAAGMLGTDLVELLRASGMDVLAADIRNCPIELDVTQCQSVRTVLTNNRPDVVIHCAAYTNVEEAETHPLDAYRVNALGAWTVAEACDRMDVALCYISTDFVFDGTKRAPYHEFDTPAPINVYGASKLAGEKAVASHCRRHWIARTAWLYGVHGRSFVRTILEKAAAGRPLRVVADQTGSPTYTRDLAARLLWLIREAPYGTYHCVNSGAASWYELARAALRIVGRNDEAVEPVPASDWPSIVRRPSYSVLTTLACPAAAAPEMRSWQEALASFASEFLGHSECAGTR